MKDLLVYYCEYNIWANKKMKSYFDKIPEGLLTQYVENSFPSIKKTVMHILSAERSWLARMQQDDSNNKSLSVDFGTTTEVFEKLITTSKDFSRFVQNQSDYFFNQSLCYNTWDGNPWEMQPKIMIHHCMNHSTYHRGQLITMIRQLGHKKNLPSTDILYYWKENAEGKIANI